MSLPKYQILEKLKELSCWVGNTKCSMGADLPEKDQEELKSRMENLLKEI